MRFCLAFRNVSLDGPVYLAAQSRAKTLSEPGNVRCSGDFAAMWPRFTPRSRFLFLALLIAVTVTAQPCGAAEGALPEDPRLAAPVTIGLGTRTLKQVVEQLGRGGKLSLSCEPELETQAAVVWTQRRPLSEVMEALALAGQFGWKATADGYRLYPRETPITTVTKVSSLQPLPAVPALGATLTWPPAFPDVDEEKL
jgi:hypothetical protein